MDNKENSFRSGNMGVAEGSAKFKESKGIINNLYRDFGVIERLLKVSPF